MTSFLVSSQLRIRPSPEIERKLRLWPGSVLCQYTCAAGDHIHQGKFKTVFIMRVVVGLTVSLWTALTVYLPHGLRMLAVGVGAGIKGLAAVVERNNHRRDI